MRLRHAAALALVGWYLMVPPTTDGKIDNSAPLSQWDIRSSFDSAATCEQAHHKHPMEGTQIVVPNRPNEKLTQAGSRRSNKDHLASRWRRRISDREQRKTENHVYGVDPGNRDCVALHASDSDLIENRTAPASGPRIDRQALAGAPCCECAVATWPDQSHEDSIARSGGRIGYTHSLWHGGMKV
jgi:hypothetical protein